MLTIQRKTKHHLINGNNHVFKVLSKTFDKANIQHTHQIYKKALFNITISDDNIHLLD